jgi:hypothetical protein
MDEGVEAWLRMMACVVDVYDNGRTLGPNRRGALCTDSQPFKIVQINNKTFAFSTCIAI